MKGPTFLFKSYSIGSFLNPTGRWLLWGRYDKITFPEVKAPWLSSHRRWLPRISGHGCVEGHLPHTIRHLLSTTAPEPDTNPCVWSSGVQPPSSWLSSTEPVPLIHCGRVIGPCGQGSRAFPCSTLLPSFLDFKDAVGDHQHRGPSAPWLAHIRWPLPWPPAPATILWSLSEQTSSPEITDPGIGLISQISP